MSKLDELENDCEAIDATIFTGDLLEDANRLAMIKEYMARWAKAIAAHEAVESAK